MAEIMNERRGSRNNGNGTPIIGPLRYILCSGVITISRPLGLESRFPEGPEGIEISTLSYRIARGSHAEIRSGSRNIPN
jgi:hypothetical protein